MKLKAPDKYGILKNKKVKNFVEHLNNRRSSGEEVTLSKALEKGNIRLKEMSAPLPKMTFDEFLNDLGIDRRRHTLENMVQLPEDQRWIVSEIFLEAIDAGMRQNNAFWQALIARSFDIDGLVAQQPQISAHNIADHGLNEGGTTTTPEDVGLVTFDTREIRTTKFERSIKLPHELKYAKLDMLELYLTKIAKTWGLQMTRRAIDVILNGDALDASMAAATIGVDDDSNALQWIDLIRIMARMGRLGYEPTTVVCPEEGAVHTLNIDELKNLQQGRSLGEVRIQGRLPTSWNYYMHSVVDEDHYVFLDPSATCVELLSEGTRVDSQKFIQSDLTLVVMRVQNAFANLFRDARIIVDQSLAFATNGWPAWMAPID